MSERRVRMHARTDPLEKQLRGEVRFHQYSNASRAWLRIATPRTKRAWRLLRDAAGWRYYAELDGFVTCEFAADATGLDLVAVGILDVRRIGGVTMLCDGFASIQWGLHDILCKSATFMLDVWRLHSKQATAYLDANDRIVAKLRDRARGVAQRRHERRVRDEEEAKRVEDCLQRGEDRINERINSMVERVGVCPVDAREEALHTRELRRIDAFMRGKPLAFAEWTPAMVRECERAGVELRLWRVGGECWVNAVYPDPPSCATTQPP